MIQDKWYDPRSMILSKIHDMIQDPWYDPKFVLGSKIHYILQNPRYDPRSKIWSKIHDMIRDQLHNPGAALYIFPRYIMIHFRSINDLLIWRFRIFSHRFSVIGPDFVNATIKLNSFFGILVKFFEQTCHKICY